MKTWNLVKYSEIQIFSCLLAKTLPKKLNLKMETWTLMTFLP
jgi:hypothetical protein